MKRLFKNMEESQIEGLKKNIKIIKKEYLRKEQINKSNLVSHLIFIKRGSLIQNNHIYEAGDIIGLSSLFSSTPFYEGNMYAQTLISIDMITKEDIVFLANSNQTIMLNLLALISDEFRKNQMHLLMLSYLENKKRLCQYFYYEYQINNAKTFLIKYKKKELAQYLLMEPKALSIELNKLINLNIISNQNKLYTILDIQSLIDQLK